MNRDRTKKTRETRWPPFLVLVLPATGLLALISLPLLRPDFPDPDDQSLNWRIYQNQPLGFQMEVPQEYHIEEIDDEVRMSFQDTTLVSISLLDFEAAQQRGLWASHHPDGEFVLGGISGHHYSYHHFDLLFGVHVAGCSGPLSRSISGAGISHATNFDSGGLGIGCSQEGPGLERQRTSNGRKSESGRRLIPRSQGAFR